MSDTGERRKRLSSPACRPKYRQRKGGAEAARGRPWTPRPREEEPKAAQAQSSKEDRPWVRRPSPREVPTPWARAPEPEEVPPPTPWVRATPAASKAEPATSRPWSKDRSGQGSETRAAASAAPAEATYAGPAASTQAPWAAGSHGSRATRGVSPRPTSAPGVQAEQVPKRPDRPSPKEMAMKPTRPVPGAPAAESRSASEGAATLCPICRRWHTASEPHRWN